MLGSMCYTSAGPNVITVKAELCHETIFGLFDHGQLFVPNWLSATQFGHISDQISFSLYIYSLLNFNHVEQISQLLFLMLAYSILTIHVEQISQLLFLIASILNFNHVDKVWSDQGWSLSLYACPSVTVPVPFPVPWSCQYLSLSLGPLSLSPYP